MFTLSDVNPISPSGAAFDQVATRYDAEATGQEISRWLRALAWERLAVLFPPGARVLELGSGTGEDALWLAGRGVYVTASDASPAMLAETERKAQAAGLADRVETRPLDLADAVNWSLPAAGYDGAFSNYGPVNCIGDWKPLGAALARAVRPGGNVALGVMGPFCAWETLWNALHGNLKTAARRWRGSATARIEGVAFPVYYPTPARLRRDLGPAFGRRHLRALGVFLPPGELYGALGRRRNWARLLLRLERLAAPRWPFKYLGDHYWLELTRLP